MGFFQAFARMEVFMDVVTNEEFFSNALKPTAVADAGTITTSSGDELPILVSFTSTVTSEALAGMPEAEDGEDDGEEKKLDYFWQFPHNENEASEALLDCKTATDKSGKKLTPYKAFLANYFRGYAKSVVKAHAKRFPEGSDGHIPEEELKKGLAAFADWVKANRKSLQCYGPESYISEGGDGKVQVSSMAFLKWESEAEFFFFRPAFYPKRF